MLMDTFDRGSSSPHPILEGTELQVQAIAEYHIGFHIDHMKEILKALGKG